jgi:predicted oxidoreductase
MGIAHIDVLLIHRPDPMMDHHETGAALDGLIDSGKVRAVGASNFRPWDWTLLQSAMRHPLVTNQIELSLKKIAPFTNGDLAFHQEHDHVVMAWSPLGGGDLMTTDGELGNRLDSIAARYGADRTRRKLRPCW